MATGSDIREIFQLKPASEQVRRAPRTEKKPDGISRELYGLIGNNVSTVAFNNPAYKPKLNLRTKAVSWTWRPFVNPMRDDDMVLHHWQKAMSDPNEEYYFSRYNKVINLQEYTPEEYVHLQDPDWTMEETAYLWDLCRRFDLRWVVIQDRYEWPPREEDAMAYQTIGGIVPKPEPSASVSTTAAATTSLSSSNAMDASSDITTQPNAVDSTAASSALTTPSTTTDAATASSTPAQAPATTAPSTPAVAKKEEDTIVRKTRSMEELKARYYDINQRLIRLRMRDSSQAVEKAQLLSSMAYDKNREIERKKNLEILNTRTPEQIEEEEALYLEARRIDQNEKKITKERENLLRLLSLRDMYGPGGPASAGLSAGGSLVGGGGSGIIIPSNSINISSGPTSAQPGKGSAPATPVTPTAASAAALANASTAPAAASTTTTTSGANKKRKKNAKQTEESVAASSSTKGGNANNRRLSNASATDTAVATTSGTGSGGSNGGAGGSGLSSSSSSIAAAVPAPVKKEKLTPGAYLRSQKMTPIVSTKVTRVQTTLGQLGLPYKPNMPTATVMAKWDQLQTNIVTLLDLKKHVDKLENDLKVSKLRQAGGGKASGKGASTASATAASASAASGTTSSSSTSGPNNVPGSVGSLSASSVGAGEGSAAGETHYGVKREGAPDDAGSTGQVKKKKSRKE